MVFDHWTASTKFTLAKYLQTLYNINQIPLIMFYCLIIYVKDVNLNLLLEKKQHRNMYNYIKIDRQGLQLPFKSTQELNYIGYNINRIAPTNIGIFFNTKKQFVLCVFFFKYVKRELITYYMKYNVI